MFKGMLRICALLILLAPVMFTAGLAAAEKPAISLQANGEKLTGLWLGKNGDIAVYRAISFATRKQLKLDHG